MLYDPSKERPVDASGWILWNAADYIEKHGWCQCVTENARGEVCAMGGINAVYGEDIYAANEAINRLGKRLGRYIARWNDAPGRTKEQVIAALRAAALAPHE